MTRSGIVTAALLMSLSVMAQNKGLSIGFEGGPSFVSLQGTHFSGHNFQRRLSASAGFVIQYNFDERFALHSVLGFERKGSQAEIVLTDHTGLPLGKMNLNQSLDYVTLPVLFRAGFGNSVRGFANAGPYFAYLVRQNWAGMAVPQITDARPFDFGISAGVGISAAVGRKCTISAELRHGRGLYNIGRQSLLSAGSLTNNSVSVLFGCVWRLAE